MFITTYKSLFKNIVRPYSINISFLFLQIKRAKTFNNIILETSTKLIPVSHMQSTKSIFVIHPKLAFIVNPVQLRQIKGLIWGLLCWICGMFVVEHTEAVETVIFPTAWETDLSAGIVKHSVALKLSLRVELSFVPGSTLKIKVSIGSITNFGGFFHAFLVFEHKRKPFFQFFDRIRWRFNLNLLSMCLIYNFNGRVKLPRIYFSDAFKMVIFWGGNYTGIYSAYYSVAFEVVARLER